MKRTKKVNPNISILSYNISWESMTGKKSDWWLCSNNTNIKHEKHFSKCVINIADVINNNDTDFILLQEASEYMKLMENCPKLKLMNMSLHYSGKDGIITFWKKQFRKKYIFNGEFENGRPWLSILFTNLICLINVHFGHYTKQKLIYHLETLLTTIITTLKNKYPKLNINNIRFIIAGDFNYDIKTLSTNTTNFTINNTIFFFNNKHLLTCCKYTDKHTDHVIDTKSTPLNIFIPQSHPLASDHKPIISILQS